VTTRAVLGVASSVLLCFASASSAQTNPALCAQQNAGNQNWRANIDWCIGNSDAGGSVDCPDKYVTYPECIVSGGRSCLMKKAIQSAKDKDYANSFRLAQICQCHNVGARDGIIYCGGQQGVGDYLKAK
jgi:hypothetical protein